MRGRLTYANVVATLALFIALGGGAYAAIKLKKDSVKSKHVAPDALLGEDILESTLGVVPSATNADSADTAGDAALLDGLDSSDFAKFKSTVLLSPGSNPADGGAALVNAIESLTPSAANPALILLEPGTYDISAEPAVTVAPFVTVAGFGRRATTVQGGLNLGSDTTLRDLSAPGMSIVDAANVLVEGASITDALIDNSTNLTIADARAGGSPVIVDSLGIRVERSSLTNLDIEESINVTVADTRALDVTATGGNAFFSGVRARDLSVGDAAFFNVDDSAFTGHVTASDSGTFAIIRDSEIFDGVEVTSDAAASLLDVEVQTATNDKPAVIIDSALSVFIDRSDIQATSGAFTTVAVDDTDSTSIVDSRVSNFTLAAALQAVDSQVFFGNSRLIGTTNEGGTGEINCLRSFNGSSYEDLDNSCQPVP